CSRKPGNCSETSWPRYDTMPETLNPQGMDLDDFIDAFEAAQARDGAAALPDFLPPPHHPLYSVVLRELVRVDLAYNWRRGRPLRLEHYRHSFPELFHHRDSLREIAFEEYRLRLQAGEDVSPAEYQQRYGVATDDWPGTPGAGRDVRKSAAVQTVDRPGK